MLDLGGPPLRSSGQRRAPHPVRTALIALGVLGLVVLWARYAPLEAGRPTDCPPGTEEVPTTQLDPRDYEEFGDRAALCAIRNVHETDVVVTASVRNTGPIGVRVTGLRLSGVPGVFHVEALAALPADDPTDVAAAEPFTSLRIPGGEERVIAVRLALPHCENVDRARVATFPELPLRGRVLGLPRDVDLALDPVVRLEAEPCPPGAP